MRLASIALVIVLAPPLRACAQARRLGLAETIKLAQEHSFTLRAADARVAAAEARRRGAGALSSPTATVAAHAGSTAAAGTDEDLILSQTIELGDKRRQRMHEAGAERAAALSDRAGTVADVALAAQNAYFEAQRAASERQLAADALANAKAFADAAEIQFRAGDVARSNVVRSQVEVSRAEQALAAADTELANRMAAVRSLTGMPAGQQIELSDPLALPAAEYKIDQLRSTAQASRADIRSARALLEARKAAAHAAKTQGQPDLFAEGRRASLDPNNGAANIRVGITLPIFDLGRTRADASAARAAVTEQEAVLAETNRTALLEVESAARTLESARKNAESFRAGRLDRAKELLEMARTGYEKGASSYLELLDAQQVYRSEQVEYARALAAYNEARAALEHAVGGRLP